MKETHQEVLQLIPHMQSFIDQNFNQLKYICNPNLIKLYLKKLYNLISLPVFNNITKDYKFYLVKEHLIFLRQLFANHLSLKKKADLRLINIIEQQQYIIKGYYKWLKEGIESIEDLNRRISKNIKKPISNKIRNFLIRATNPVKGKLAAGQILSEMITNEVTDQSDSVIDEKIVLKNFYKLFIENAFYLLEQEEREEQYLKNLQGIILDKISKHDNLSLHWCFDILVDYAKEHYSEHIILLLHYFCENTSVIKDVSTNPQQYSGTIIDFFKFIAEKTQKETDEAIIKSKNEIFSQILAALISLYPEDKFIYIIKECLDEVTLFFPAMYQAWITIFLENNDSTAVLNKTRSKNIIDNLKQLFKFLHKHSPDLLFEQMQKVITPDNLEVTSLFLREMFPNNSVASVLDSISDNMDLKYFFGKLFFELLQNLPEFLHLNQDKLELFLNIALYIVNADQKNDNEITSEFPIDEKLLPEGLQFVPVSKDGNCLYNAVALYLGQDVSLLRNIVAVNLEHNIEEYRPFITLPTGRTIENYIEDIRSTNEWAGDLEITILSKLLNRPIISIGSDGHIVNREVLDKQPSGEPIFVHYDQINHYDGLVLKELSSGSILEKLLQKSPPEMTENMSTKLDENSEVIACKFEDQVKESLDIRQTLKKLQTYIEGHEKSRLDNRRAQLQQTDQKLKQQTQKKAVLDILKITAGHGSWSLRAKITIDMLKDITNNRYFNNAIDDVKVAMLSIFIDNKDLSEEPTFYRQLSKTGYIHLLKNIESSERRDWLVEKLKTSNKAFCGYCAYLQSSGINFDLSQLTQGFNVPFYLSFTAELDLPEEDYNLVMALVFKIFTHAADDYNNRAIDDYGLEFNEIINSVQRLLKFYDDQKEELKAYEDHYVDLEKEYTKLKQDVIKFIIEGFSENNFDLLAERKRNARLIIDNAINYKGSKQQICSVNSVIDLELNKFTAETPSIIQQFFKEISNIFKNNLARDGKNLTEWVDSTSSIGEKVAFLCARRKYSESDFKAWFFNKNSNKFTAEQLETQLNLVRQDLDQIKHKEALSKVGINYLQYNQEYALALIYKHLQDHNSSLNQQQEHNNIFMQLGTGQGKSLVIAETACKILNENSTINQIFIITCYSHLAVRDHKRFEPFFNKFGIKAICSVKLTEEQTSDVNLLLEHKVIYTDLKSYFDLIRSERKKLLEDQPGLLFPDPKNCILIMDEFDSLILDADEIYQYLTNYPGVGLLAGDQKQKIKSFFGLNDPSTDLALQNRLFDNWYNNMLHEKQRNPDGYTKESSLGIFGNFAKAFLKHLEETGTAQFVHSFVSPLLFYTQFKQVIGFSGSITEKAMVDLEKIFCSSTGQPKNSDYYSIPPFFGQEEGKNRIFTNGPNGKLCSSEIEFLDEIIKEVKAKRQQGQPILIFADLTPKQGINQRSDFDLIEERLQIFVAEEQLHVIKNEEEVVEKLHYIGKKDSVTLASRILARGADIKVDHYITQGLHLIVTYYPPRGSVYTQMLGRTARQDEHGSYAVITMQKENYAKGNPIVYPSLRKRHELCNYFFEKNRQGKKKWPLVFDILSETSMHEDLEQLKNTIDRNFPRI